MNSKFATFNCGAIVWYRLNQTDHSQTHTDLIGKQFRCLFSDQIGIGSDMVGLVYCVLFLTYKNMKTIFFWKHDYLNFCVFIRATRVPCFFAPIQSIILMVLVDFFLIQMIVKCKFLRTLSFFPENLRFFVIA